MIPSWFVGERDASAAYHFINDLSERLASRIQLTTDGHRPYVQAVEDEVESYAAIEAGEVGEEYFQT